MMQEPISTHAATKSDAKPDLALVIVTPSAGLAGSLRQFLSSWKLNVIDVVESLAGLQLRPSTAWKEATLLLDYTLIANGSRRSASHAKSERLHPRVLVFSNREAKDEQKLALLQAGAAGFVPLSRDLHLLVKAIAVVGNGGFWFERSVLVEALRSAYGPGMDIGEVREPRADWGPTASSALTPRENVVAAYVAQGLRNREIASQLCIAEQTVKLHLTRIYQKMGISNRIQLGLLAHYGTQQPWHGKREVSPGTGQHPQK